MEWISIEDELPEDNSWVLAYSGGAMNCVGYDVGIGFNNCQFSSNLYIPTISHWAKLPNRPTSKLFV